jgi:hypothetical protein
MNIQWMKGEHSWMNFFLDAIGGDVNDHVQQDVCYHASDDIGHDTSDNVKHDVSIDIGDVICDTAFLFIFSS